MYIGCGKVGSVLFGGFLWSLINVNLHLTTDNKIGLDTTSIYSKLPDFT